MSASELKICADLHNADPVDPVVGDNFHVRKIEAKRGQKGAKRVQKVAKKEAY